MPRLLLRVCLWLMMGASAASLHAADPDPSKTSTVGMTVHNPVTNTSTTVSGLITDPPGTPTAGTTAYVRTADGYVFIVKNVGEVVYNLANPPTAYNVVSKDTTAKTVALRPVGADPATVPTANLSYQSTFAALDLVMNPPPPPPGPPPSTVTSGGSDGIRSVFVGGGGSGGRDGAFFVPPSSGGNGGPGPINTYTNTTTITTNGKIGLEIGSVGGRGGNGGDSVFSFWDGADGGDGGAGGPVTVTNNAAVTTVGDNMHGIYAYSRGGQAGNGGGGYLAPGGGTGGHSSNGGNVTVTNNGTLTTSGTAAYGIYAMSVSNNGGSGGDSWGLVGTAGSGGFGGSGGTVIVTNSASGTIHTTGNVAHGIFAQSIGGSGGSSGTSANLILALPSNGDNGGNGSTVQVFNSGTIITEGTDARGIFAQSIGGGGGSGGTAAGLIAIGGAGSNGGSAGAVTVQNLATGSVTTSGLRSDAIFAQSVGGSSGGGANAGGLVSVGGNGAAGGNGGTVTVENLGIIATSNDYSRGMVAQSIGGGGGDGGSTGGIVSVGGSGSGGGIGQLVTIKNAGSITTTGVGSLGIMAQSIGGGGGNGGSSGSVGVFAGLAVGGNGGGGGAGGNVNVTLQGQDANTASVINTTGDRSMGLFAQSVGGGGGNGGGAIQVSVGFGAAGSFAVGGKGGTASNGGIVNLSKGTGVSIIETGGDDSAGLFLQSVGGGGGNGGYAVAVAVSAGPASGSLSVGIGGSGGSAGLGGQVTVGSFAPDGTLISTGFDGSILTQGNRSTGFLAQSVGGGGGNGGLAVAAAASASLTVSGSISVGLGGSGGSGGAGGIVQVGTGGNITTEGNSSTALLVQSVGGGGGNGGGSIAAALAVGNGAGTVGLALGGDGGAGSTGGVVNVATTAGTIRTSGMHSGGIVIQSIGGGGGNGGYSVSASAAIGAVGAGSVNLGLGGTGGTGGTGGNVTADLQSNVETASVKRALDPATDQPIPEAYMSDSTGVLVQSVGGGGGNGGFNVTAGGAAAGTGSGAVTVGLGGNGATGGTGGIVNVKSTGTITTNGDRSAGLIAESLGGGGGNGGYNVSVSGSGAGVGSGAIAVGLGGTGGSGNFAQAVTVNTSIGKITTNGSDSTGILAQSVGGGGGNGGYNVSVAATGAGTGSGAISVGLGGNGGTGGYAGSVNLTVANAVSTTGKNSAAVVAQAIGGGGGNGGYNVAAGGAGAGTGAGAISVGLGGSGAAGGNGGAVTALVSGNIDTLLENSTGIMAQSIGGGGGNGGYNVSLSGAGAGTGAGAVSIGLGGSGGGAGDGLKVDLTSQGTILTKGANSTAFIAQSIGGGGGNGGFNVAVAISGAGTGSGAASVGLGGSGAGGGSGGIVVAKTSGDIMTEGDKSGGILAQSVGGGGGNGGFNVNVAGSFAGTGSGAVSVGLGGSGAGGGSASDVTLTVNNNVTTKGKKSTGIVVQSVGGGGGNGGFDVTAPISGAGTGSGAVGVGLGGSAGTGGDAGVATSIITGTITTAKEGSGGMLTQSLGGGGGNGGMSITGAMSFGGTGSGAVSVGLGGSGGAGGNAATVNSTLTGNVYTVEKDSFGVIAQSVGGGGGSGGMSITGAVSMAKSGAGALAFGLGGAGGEGGDAGENVFNTVTGYVQTQGANSVGIFAQSLGGGGGNGGLNVSGAITASKSGSGNLAIGIGGLGGDGGLGKAVTSTVTGGVVTTGKDSAAIVAQSLGGGGGNGGINVTGTLNASKEGGGTLGIGIGGFGGNGGDSGAVTSTVTTTATYNQIGTTGDNSAGVIAQSLAGGGGNGGMNVTGAVNVSGKSGAAIGLGLGGFGGGAGNAGKVIANVTGQIVTQGNNSDGILAQSVGGGGGNGGINVSGTLAFTQADSTTAAVSIGVGGFGGGGGTGGAVDLTYTGTLAARPGIYHAASGSQAAYMEYLDGAGSNGIAAQSIGGGGGNGGLNVSSGLAYTRGTGDAYGIMIGVGGFGGAGGKSDTVDVTVNGGGSITGYGAGHSAVLAQSIGGGGGNGGTNVSGGISSDSPLIVGVGGFGANAGAAAKVTAKVTANVYASALDSKLLNSAGILAQSIGGGGGNGGLNVSGGLAISKESSVPSVTLGIGGFGGTGAISGDVIVTHVGNAITSGAWIHGILAQSLAGGGGNGGMNISGQINFADSENSGGKKDLTIVAGIGGNAGSGADAGDVTITQNGVVTTAGDHARGIFGQSLGGGGGTGGMNVTAVYAKNSSPVSVGVGGSGSGGGHAGAVTITRGLSTAATGLITTNGIAAHGIEASSIGGGGGDAGMNFNAGFSTVGKTDPGFAAVFAIGGSGGEAGNGGVVNVTNYSHIWTQKANSHGLLAQSIGGGGGNGNFNMAVTYADSENSSKDKKNLGFSLAVGGQPGDGGYGESVTVVQQGDIETMGKESFGILAQSVGGGGGNVGLDFAMAAASGGNVGITLGKNGGIGGHASAVNLTYKGTLITRGEGSFGLLAQSVGNGGGNSSSTSVQVTGADTKDDPADSAYVAVGLEGGQGGYAGTVTLNADGFVDTYGKGAHAIFAQSVGGGGGNGGSSNTFGLSTSTVDISLGGTGGTGGTGGIVNVTSLAQVRTFGAGAVGILAQSIGGGGGTGGMSRSGGVKSKVDGITIGVGGTGGEGMSAGDVTVDNKGIIITDGLGSHAILAQSLGGGGGISGMTISSTMKDAQKEASNRAVIVIGGDGGKGAVSGNVKVTNTGGIGTSKDNSIGIFAQAVGGGGGNSDYVMSSAVTGEGGGNSLSLSIGGSGGEGGSAGKVTVINKKVVGDANSGKIITLGRYAYGIMAMSVGGGGGNGSTVITTLRPSGAAASSATTSGLLFSLGGAGGTGGTGGVVEVENSGSITTYGYKAHGIIAQSIGGGGGTGGVSITGDLALGKKPADASGTVVSVALGGVGGDGNTSGNVTVTNSGSIEVVGKGAYGIYAQSVGGGGGDGGFAATISKNLLANPKTDLQKSLMNIGLGGSGGTGADSGNVVVNHSGSIIARGDNAYGIFAQSVGGGGGNSAFELTSPVWMAADLAYEVLLGGRNGTTGTAGTVKVTTSGTILMQGKNSVAQLAQSINGGGGNVNLFMDVSEHARTLGDDGIELPNNNGDVDNVLAFVNSTIKMGADAVTGAVGSAIDATHVGDLYTTAEGSLASLLQSIGGGGGNGNEEVIVDTNATVDLLMALGGTNTTDSGGGTLSSNRQGNVATLGAGSGGVTGQSIGGGGGNLSVTVRQVPAATSLMAFNALAIPPLPAGTGSLGGNGVLNSDGGAMTITDAGDVGTAGARSPAVIYQSIGGGGGKLYLAGFGSLDITVGGINGTSGDGGDVTFINTGAVITEGVLSPGILVQSIGGGGGVALTDLDAANINLTLSTANSGNGGIINVTQNGNVTALGARSTAIILQSLGGGGGLVDDMFAGTAGGTGNSGAITFVMNGNIVANGAGGTGLLAQSQGSGTQGNIEVTLAATKTLLFGNGGTGVRFSGGANNTFTNNGAIVGTEGPAGWAFRGEEGNETFQNNGAFMGSADFGSGSNKFNNATNAVLAMGPQFFLGAAGNMLTNDGAFRPGGTGLAQHTDMTGSFTQTSTGTNFTELDFKTNVVDNVSMTGSAALDGSIEVALLHPEVVPVGVFQKILIHADGGVTDNGMDLFTAPSVVINYGLNYLPSGNDLALDYSVNFNPPGSEMSRNLVEVGGHINSIQNAGSSPSLAAVIIRLLYEPTLDGYRFLLSQMGPDFYGEQQAEMLRGTQRFGETVLSGGNTRFMSQGRRIWFDVLGGNTFHGRYDDYKTVQHQTMGFAMGFESIITQRWSAGMGVALEDNNSTGYEGRWSAEGTSQRVGGVVRFRSGGTEVAGLLSYGWNHMDSSRVGQVTTPFDTNVSRNLQTFSAMLRASHQFGDDDFAVIPRLDVGVTHLAAKDATESGADAISLYLHDHEETHAWLRPAVTIRKAIPVFRRAKLRIQAEFGYQYYLTGNDTYVRGSFTGAPGGADGMNVPIDLGSMATMSIGAQLLLANDLSIGLYYTKALSQKYKLDMVNLRVNKDF